MKTYFKTIIITMSLSILGIGYGAQAMNFLEYKTILAEHSITLTTEQEQTFKKFFTKEKTAQKASQKIKQDSGLADFSYIMKNGVTDKDTNGAVTQLQTYLKQSGFDVGSIDGYYGPQTMRAVEQLKKQQGITNTPHGIFNPRDFSTDDKLQHMTMFLGTDEVFFYTLPQSALSDSSRIFCYDKEITTIEKEEQIIFPITFPYYQEDPITCHVKTGTKKQTFLTIYKKENKKETSYATITVSKTYSSISPENQKRIKDEKEMLGELYKKYSNDVAYFDEPFSLPLDTELISPYGKTRIINGKVSSFHSGTDWRARTPLPISSMNRGKVMFTGDLFYCGKGVIINHGLDIFIAYCHLSEIHVEEGDIIEQGDIIGKTGSTGRVSGPHLHVSSKFEGKYMDVMSIYNSSNIFK